MPTRLAAFAFALAALLAPAALAQAAPDIAGDWAGEMHLPQAARLAVHLRAAGDGSWSATADSPDLGAANVPLSVTLKGDTLTLSTPDGGGQRLDLKWDAALVGWSGSYVTASGAAPVTLTHGALRAWPRVDGLDGDWSAVATYEETTLHLAMHIASSPQTTAAMITSPDAVGAQLQVGEITHAGSQVTFDIPSVRGGFSGQLSADGKTLSGTYEMADVEAPVVFNRQ